MSKEHENFTSVITYFKEHQLKYDPKSREWLEKNNLATLSHIDFLRGYSEIGINEEDTLLLEDLKYPLSKNLKKIKFQLSKEYFERFPIYKGKHPHEEYQLKCIKSGLSQKSIIFDIYQGLGKTYIQSSILFHLLWKNKIDKVLWICKSEGLENTKIEILKYLSDYVTEDDIQFVESENRNIEDYFDKKIILIPYHVFRISVQYYNKLRNKKPSKKPKKSIIDFSKWGNSRALVCDEADEAKNYDAEVSHFIKTHADFFEYKTCMSGTIGYKIQDYYSFCKILIPDSMPYTWTEWSDYMADKGTYRSKYEIKEFKADKVEEFKRLVLNKLQVSCTPIQDYIELPENVITPLHIRMTSKMRELYKTFIDIEIQRMRIENQGQELHGLQLKNKFNYLAMFTSDPSLLKEKFKFNWKFEDSPKLEIVRAKLEQYIKKEKRKVIIWSNHPVILNQLADYFSEYHPFVVHGDEKTSVKKKMRHPLVEEFKHSKERHLLLSSFVLSTSINITQVTRQIYFDLTVDNKKISQSGSRPWRIGQKEAVFTDFLLMNNSVDEYIYEEILGKKDETKVALSSTSELSLEDFKNIFNRKAKPIDYN